MESEVHQTIWFQIGKSSFYFWNQCRILVHFNLHKSPPWKLKSPLNLINHKIAPRGAISPILNATDLDKGFEEFAKTTRKVRQLY